MLHPSKQGRKNKRLQCHYLKKVFIHSFSIKQLSVHSSLSADTLRKRFSKSIDSVVNKKRVIRIRGSHLILIIDAQWQYSNSQLRTLYFIAIEATTSQKVTVFDPVLKQGREKTKVWDEIINQLPQPAKKRVITLVSDRIRDIETIVEKNGWIMQRCHSHLLSMLQKMRGKRASTPGCLVREEIYQTVQQILTERSRKKLNTLCKHLAVLAHSFECPKKINPLTAL